MTVRAGAPRRISILGATGSIGCNTVDLIARQPDGYAVEALTGNCNVALLAEQARHLRARLAVIGDPARYRDLKEALSGTDTEVAAGAEAIVEAARRPADWVMAAIVGIAGLRSTLAAIERGTIVALANKECLVSAGGVVLQAVRDHGATLLPVDSEHNAVFQVFDFTHPERVERIILTASGGPFRNLDREAMAKVTRAQAVNHPNWEMGAKISVDSATMMNKGLELIEAVHLFPVPPERIDILVHPQSVVHSMVAYVDGSVLAQLGTPDMRTPIAFTLAWPDRLPAPAPRLDLPALPALSFEKPDSARFPALRLAREALAAGGAAPTVLNAANEVAVQSFLAGEIGFLDIADIVERALAEVPGRPLASLADVEDADRGARDIAKSLISKAGMAR